jgi:hypothetical protein
VSEDIYPPLQAGFATTAANFLAVAAALEKSTMGSLRDGTYCDVYGNPISTQGLFYPNRNIEANRLSPADPDLSNPTRRRTERPLETIRSFEAAIDGEFNRKRRESVMLRPGRSPHTSVYGIPQRLTVKQKLQDQTRTTTAAVARLHTGVSAFSSYLALQWGSALLRSNDWSDCNFVTTIFARLSYIPTPSPSYVGGTSITMTETLLFIS